VKAMMDVWEKISRQLRLASDEVLSLTNYDDAAFQSKKDQFVTELKAFCQGVEEMNREYTSRVLALLSDQVKRSLTKTDTDKN
jgi:hypothetical protein